MGYEVLSNTGIGTMGNTVNVYCPGNKCSDINANCNDNGCGNPIDFKCSRNGGCKACSMLKSSRFSDF